MPPTNFDCASLSMINLVIRLISIGKYATVSTGESSLNTLIENELYGLSFLWEHSNNSSSLEFQLAL